MNKETILSFINDVIIENAIENNLDSETIKKSIEDYKKYLSESGLADKDVLKTISVIEEKLDEYVELAKSFKKAGIPLPTIKIAATEKPKRRVEQKNQKPESTSGIQSRNEGRTQGTYQSFCASERGISRSSC